MQYLENDGLNHGNWKMQDHIDLDLMCEFELQLHRNKLEKNM